MSFGSELIETEQNHFCRHNRTKIFLHSHCCWIWKWTRISFCCTL